MSRSKQRSHCTHSCGMCSPRKGKGKHRKVFRKRERVILDLARKARVVAQSV